MSRRDVNGIFFYTAYGLIYELSSRDLARKQIQR